MAALNPNDVDAVRQDLQQAVLPLMDEILLECFVQGIIKCQAFTQVLRCDAAVKQGRFCLAVQQSITRGPDEKYKAFLEVLKKVLPKEQSTNLLKKSKRSLKAAVSSLGHLSDGGMRLRSFSEPEMSKNKAHMRPKYVPSFSETPNASRKDEVDTPADDDGGGLRIKSIPSSRGNDDLTELNERQHFVVPVQESGDHSYAMEEKDFMNIEDQSSNLKQRKNIKNGDVLHQVRGSASPRNATDGTIERRSILTAITRWHHTKLECQQREAEVSALNKEVSILKRQLSSAETQNIELELRVQRQTETIESLRRKKNKKILALRKEIQSSETLKQKVAELEVDRHRLNESLREHREQRKAEMMDFKKQVDAISLQYEQEIAKIESARKKDKQKLEKITCQEIPRLQTDIIEKVEKIEELSRFYRLYLCVRCVFIVVLILCVFVLALFAYIRW